MTSLDEISREGILPPGMGLPGQSSMHLIDNQAEPELQSSHPPEVTTGVFHPPCTDLIHSSHDCNTVHHGLGGGPSHQRRKSRPWKRLKDRSVSTISICRNGFGGDREILIIRLHNLTCLIKLLTPKQLDDVREIGFGPLLSMPLPQMREWLIKTRKPISQLWKENGKPRFVLAPYNVSSAFGIPWNKSKPVLEDVDHPSVINILSAWKAIYHIPASDAIKASELQGLMPYMVHGGADFKRMFILYVLHTYLTPGDDDTISVGVLKSLVKVENIRELHWAGYVFDYIRRKHETVSGSWMNRGCQGCVPFLLLEYFRRSTWYPVAAHGNTGEGLNEAYLKEVPELTNMFHELLPGTETQLSDELRECFHQGSIEHPQPAVVCLTPRTPPQFSSQLCKQFGPIKDPLTKHSVEVVDYCIGDASTANGRKIIYADRWGGVSRKEIWSFEPYGIITPSIISAWARILNNHWTDEGIPCASVDILNLANVSLGYEQVAIEWQHWQLAFNLDFKSAQQIFIPFRHLNQNALLVVKFKERKIQFFVDCKPADNAAWENRARQVGSIYWTFMLHIGDIRSNDLLEFSYEVVNPFVSMSPLENDYSCGVVLMHVMECLSDSNYDPLHDPLLKDLVLHTKISICYTLVMSNMNRRRAAVLSGVAQSIRRKDASIASTSYGPVSHDASTM